jgi:hypothetical protein
MLSPYVLGSGTANYLPKFNASRSIVDSKVYETGTNLMFNTTTPYISTSGYGTFDINGSTASVFVLKKSDTARGYWSHNGTTMDINNLSAGDIRFYTQGSLRGRFQTDGTFRLNSLTGTGTRSVVADANGVLSASSTPTDLIDTTYISTRAWRQKGDDSLGAIIATKGSGTVTSVATGYGLSGGTITTTGTISADTALLASRLRVGKVVDSLALVKQNVLTNPVTGTGTTNYVPKFTGTSTVGNSIMHDDGTRIAIGSTSTPSSSNIRQLIKGTSTNNPYIQIENGGGGGMTIGSNNGAGVQIYNFTGSTGSETYTEVVEINSDAEFQINNLSDAGDYKLQVNGNIYNTGGAVFSAASGVVRINTTTNPSPATVKLFLKGTTTQDIYLGLENGGGGGGYIGSNNGPGLQFYRYTGSAPSETSITKTLEINSASELLVANASDAGDYKLQVSGNAYVTGGAILAASSGNVGIGTLPSAWSWLSSIMQFRFGGHIAVADNSFMQIGANSYYDGSNYVRVNAGYSSRYLQNDGGHFWSSATTSTAGSTVTFSENMRLTRDAELLLNTTTDAGAYVLQTNGSIYTSGSAVSQMVLNTTNANGSANLYQQSGSTIGWLGNGSSSVIGGSTSDFGINSQSALFFATGGYRAATINLSSELLLNTTLDAGDYKLQVSGNAYVYNASAGSAVVSMMGGARAGALGLKIFNETIAQSTIIALGEESGTSSTPFFIRRYGSTNANASAVEIVNGQNAAMWLSTNGTERIRLHANGGLKFVGQSAAPTAEAGTVYYDTDDNKLKVYNGTTWVDLH